MHPILFHLGPLTLYSYGLMVALAFLLGSIWVAKRAQRAGENVDLYFQAIFWIIVIGFTGARLMYVLYYPALYLKDPLRILLDRGGLVWYGGLIAAIAAALTFARIKKIQLAKFGDILMIPAALGLAIGRVGCFLSGCCYGKPTTVPWAVQFPPGHETYPSFVHPTQLYESASLVLFTLILLFIEKRTRTPGVVMASFFIGYGIIRFIIEHFRGDGIFWIGHLLTASQVISLVGVLVGIGLLFFFKSSQTPASIIAERKLASEK